MVSNLVLNTGKILFKYTTSHLSATEKVRFFYELKGRANRPGILTTTDSQYLSKSLILAPFNAERHWLKFFKSWNCPAQSAILRPPQSSKLNQIANNFKQKHSEISDILLVSAQTKIIRGKAIFLLLSHPNEKLASEFEKISGIHTYTFLTAQLFNPENKRWLDIFSQGTSLLTSEKKTKTLISYKTTLLRGTEKVKFFYAFKGRGAKPGILEQTNSASLAKGVIITATAQTKKISKFFQSWGCTIEKTNCVADEEEINTLQNLSQMGVAATQ